MKQALKKSIRDLFITIFALRKPGRWSVLIAEQLTSLIYQSVGKKGQKINLVTTNPILLYRAQTVYTKEPETTEWIEQAPAGQIFFDVGANIGLYSMMAAQAGHRVYAFEPTNFNYSLLNKNIYLNNLSDKITAYPLAISDEMKFDTIRLSSFDDGSALHNFGADLDLNHENFKPVFRQGCVAFSLDQLVSQYNFPCPTYLKIDVDGLEHKIIKGAQKVLKDQRLKSILIELNEKLAVDNQIITDMQNLGFKLKTTGEKHLGIGNLIFNR